MKLMQFLQQSIHLHEQPSLPPAMTRTLRRGNLQQLLSKILEYINKDKKKTAQSKAKLDALEQYSLHEITLKPIKSDTSTQILTDEINPVLPLCSIAPAA